MKYLIVGLGNMGAEYDRTRHNVGFDIVDSLAEEHDCIWKHDTLGDVTMFKEKGRTYHLLKPSTYMNRSGKAVNYWIQKHKLLPQNLLVVVDDLNLNFGQVRLRGKGKDGGHNGLRDIQEKLGSNAFARLRIGIGSEFHKGQQVNFVIGKWSEEEWKNLQPIIEHAKAAVKAFGFQGLQRAMSSYNK